MVLPPSSGQESDLGRVRRLAELLWERVERVRERAEGEARSLAQRVDAYGDALGRPSPAESAVSEELEVRREQSEARRQKQESWSRQAEDGESRSVESDQPERLAAEILETFREKGSGKLRKGGNERVIRLALYDLAVGRFGKQDDFELLKRTHDRFNQLHHEFFEAFFSQFHQARPDAGSG